MDETIAVIGGGPAGLMAAEVLSAAGRSVTVYDRMPSLGRKFLMAGRGGLNLTHSEDFRPFLGRYGAAGKAHTHVEGVVVLGGGHREVLSLRRRPACAGRS